MSSSHRSLKRSGRRESASAEEAEQTATFDAQVAKAVAALRNRSNSVAPTTGPTVSGLTHSPVVRSVVFDC